MLCVLNHPPPDDTPGKTLRFFNTATQQICKSTVSGFRRCAWLDVFADHDSILKKVELKAYLHTNIKLFNCVSVYSL